MISDLPPGFSLEALNRYLKSLYDADWEDPRGVIRFSAGTKLAELAHAEFFHNTRVFLNALGDEGGTPTTSTGNLNRAFVARLLDRLHLSPTYRKSVKQVCKVINEMDVWPLHEVRVVSQLGNLMAKRNKRLVLTKEGRELLADDRAGELFRRLFLTYFRKLDLCYIVHLREIPEIQATLAIIFWRLGQVAADWRAVEGIAQQILPPRLSHHIRATQRSNWDTEDWLVSQYVLTPLKDFGLIEPQRESEWNISEKDVIRVSPLFQRFISFAPPPSFRFDLQ